MPTARGWRWEPTGTECPATVRAPVRGRGRGSVEELPEQTRPA
ncbi:hypothetical protein [Cryptosporangium sp. NPDC048952]